MAHPLRLASNTPNSNAFRLKKVQWENEQSSVRSWTRPPSGSLQDFRVEEDDPDELEPSPEERERINSDLSHLKELASRDPVLSKPSPAEKPFQKIKQPTFASPNSLKEFRALNTSNPYLFIDKKLGEWLSNSKYMLEVDTRFCPLMNAEESIVRSFAQWKNTLVQCGLFPLDVEVFPVDASIALNCSFRSFDTIEESKDSRSNNGYIETRFVEEDLLALVEDDLRVKFYFANASVSTVFASELQNPPVDMPFRLLFYLYITCF